MSRGWNCQSGKAVTKISLESIAPSCRCFLCHQHDFVSSPRGLNRGGYGETGGASPPGTWDGAPFRIARGIVQSTFSKGVHERDGQGRSVQAITVLPSLSRNAMPLDMICSTYEASRARRLPKYRILCTTTRKTRQCSHVFHSHTRPQPQMEDSSPKPVLGPDRLEPAVHDKGCCTGLLSH